MEQGGGGEVVEEASPISSRPPASVEELLRFSGDDVGGGSSSGNRWPREETLALLRIRSDMDAAFRDATLKAPLWEDVSRKLGELGYKLRSGKKCKEKFENVQKYYKRTKEGRGGRHEGKAYKFFTQLEALQTASSSSSAPPPISSTLDVAPLSVANPPPPQPPPPPPPPSSHLPQQQQQQPFPAFTPPPVTSFAPPALGVTFSSHSSSTASSSMGYDDDPGTSSSRKRKRKRKHSRNNMMEFFESLMRKVLQKQASMQRSFLEVLEKREQERLNREEAWKRQETSRLTRDHQLMAQEHAASASRDAAIVSLIQKITGHTLHLPPSVTLSAAPPPPPPPGPPQSTTAAKPSPLQQQQMHEPSLVAETVTEHQTSQLQPIMAIPEQQIPPPPPPPQVLELGESAGSEPASSRWPKAEVVALINLRSGMESKYQEGVPKGPLWEEIAAGMRRMGYNRNAKRCKEKWENINKYYKKIKESNKKRPEDAKTCPYFHQLDALYRDKVLGSCSGQPPQEQTSTQHPKDSSEMDPVSSAARPSPSISEQVDESSSPGGAGEKTEDIVREMMQRYTHDHEQEQVAMEQEEGKMAYEIKFKQQDGGAGGKDRASSFLTMVQ